jgi:GDPmannose 4,6-dehydratase
MKAIIFGANGQDGVYLSALLQQKGYCVTGIDRNTAGVHISNFEEVCQVVKTLQPVYIFHLAANSTTRIDAWQENHETICTGSLNILEAVRLWSPATKVFLSGSGLQFVNHGLPIKETDPFFAGSAYAVSRIHTVYAARFYRQQGVKAYTGYFFTHDSPGRTERHINKKISETVKRIAGGSREKLSIGDLSVKKEFGFAGDIVQGIMTLVEQDSVYECVIGTGKAHSIEEWIDICFSGCGLRWQEHVETLPGFTAEYAQLVSDPSTLFSLGWKPATEIHSLAKMMLA